MFRRIGITFAVYGEGGDPDRLIPFDMFPRVFTANEWAKLERGIKQRARALNAFLVDVYGRGEIVRAGRIPGKLVYQNDGLREIGLWLYPAKRRVFSYRWHRHRAHRAGGVLCAGGQLPHTVGRVSYMLESREMMMRMFPDLFRENRIEPIDSYPDKLRRTLASGRPRQMRPRPDRGDPDAGAFQLGLLRAQLSCRSDGR